MIDSMPISFPRLGWTFDFPNYFKVFNFTIYFYAVIICVGVILAYIYASRRASQFGMTTDNLLDGIIFGVPTAIIGARLWYCLFAPAGEITTFLDVFKIRNGGLAIYGAVFFTGIFLIIFCRVKKLRFGNVADLVSLGFLIGQTVGRLGNFVNREVYGIATSLPWGMRIGKVSVHPLFLYEILWNLIGFIVLHFVSKKRKFPGQIALMYLAWYGLGRGLMEGLRDPQFIELIGNLPIHQIVAFTVFAVALFVLIVKLIEAKKLGTVSFEYVGSARKAAKEAEAVERRKDYKPMYDSAELEKTAEEMEKKNDDIEQVTEAAEEAQAEAEKATSEAQTEAEKAAKEVKTEAKKAAKKTKAEAELSAEEVKTEVGKAAEEVKTETEKATHKKSGAKKATAKKVVAEEAKKADKSGASDKKTED